MKTEVFIFGKLLLFDIEKGMVKVSTGKRNSEFYAFFENRDSRFLPAIKKIEKLEIGCYVTIKGYLESTEKNKKIKIICTSIHNAEMTNKERVQIDLFSQDEE